MAEGKPVRPTHSAAQCPARFVHCFGCLLFCASRRGSQLSQRPSRRSTWLVGQCSFITSLRNAHRSLQISIFKHFWCLLKGGRIVRLRSVGYVSGLVCISHGRSNCAAAGAAHPRATASLLCQASFLCFLYSRHVNRLGVWLVQ